MKIRIKNEPMIKYLQFGERFFMLVKDFTGKWNYWLSKKPTAKQSMNWCKICKYRTLEFFQTPCNSCTSLVLGDQPCSFDLKKQTKEHRDAEYQDYCDAIDRGEYYPDPRD